MLDTIRAKTAGFKTYAIAFLLCLPDLLDAIGVVDITPIVPEGYGTQAATFLTLARIVIGVTIKSMRKQLREELNDKPDGEQ